MRELTGSDHGSLNALPLPYPALTFSGLSDLTILAYGVQCAGVVVRNCQNLQVYGLSVYDAPLYGVSFTADTQGCGFYGGEVAHAMTGFSLQGSGHTIQGYTIHDMRQYNNPTPPAWADANGFHVIGDGHQILDNLIYDIGLEDSPTSHNDGIQFTDNDPNTNHLVARNEIYMTRPGPSAVCIMLSGGLPIENIIIEDNILYGWHGVNLAKGGRDIVIRQNILAGRDGDRYDPQSSWPGPFAWENPVTGGVVEENILLNCPGPALKVNSGPLPTMANNLLWGGTPGDLTGYVEKDPQLDENYRYTAGRPGAGPKVFRTG